MSVLLRVPVDRRTVRVAALRVPSRKGEVLDGRRRQLARGCLTGPARGDAATELYHPSRTVDGVKVREVIRILEREGWRIARQTGSHRQFRHPNRPGTVTVAGKPSIEVPRGTLASIWRQAGWLPKEERD